MYPNIFNDKKRKRSLLWRCLLDGQVITVGGVPVQFAEKGDVLQHRDNSEFDFEVTTTGVFQWIHPIILTDGKREIGKPKALLYATEIGSILGLLDKATEAEVIEAATARVITHRGRSEKRTELPQN